MIEIAAAIVFLALVVVPLYFHDRERQAWYAERRSLLDRLQAPSWDAFKAFGGDPKPPTKIRQMTDDEAEYEEEQRRERESA